MLLEIMNSATEDDMPRLLLSIQDSRSSLKRRLYWETSTVSEMEKKKAQLNRSILALRLLFLPFFSPRPCLTLHGPQLLTCSHFTCSRIYTKKHLAEAKLFRSLIMENMHSTTSPSSSMCLCICQVTNSCMILSAVMTHTSDLSCPSSRKTIIS